MLLGLRTTIYKVADLDQAKIWYSKVLGHTPYFDQPFYVGFSVAGYELGLTPEETASPKVDTVSTYWGVDNVGAAYQRLIELGATELEPSPTSCGGSN